MVKRGTGRGFRRQANHTSATMNTPIRRLEGVSYWVIQDPEGIGDYVNTEVRVEWEHDVASMPNDPAGGTWLATLSKRHWRLEILKISEISLDQRIMNNLDSRTGYNFAERLAQRRQELRKGLELWGRVIPPIVIRREDMQVLDGYCRFTTLVEMGIQRVYAYMENL